MSRSLHGCLYFAHIPRLPIYQFGRLIVCVWSTLFVEMSTVTPLSYSQNKIFVGDGLMWIFTTIKLPTFMIVSTL